MRTVTMAALVCISRGALAQTPLMTPRVSWPVFIDPASATTGSLDEDNLLLLQLAGRTPFMQTSIRSFSARLRDTLVSLEHPRGPAPRRFEWARPAATLRYNAQRPYSRNDGAVWAGRGLTISASGGGVARLGAFSFALRPVAFWSANRPFQPPLGATADAVHFANVAFPAMIDLPYRFGNHGYGRVDPGESWVQLDTRYIVAGISTATQAWGPMHVYPMLLGPNAGGFPHLLFGTGLPWNIGIGKVSGRAAIGRLDASAFAPRHPGDQRRLASELVAVFTPAGLTGLEIGGGRFFHRRWPINGIDAGVLRIPFEGFLKEKLPTKDSPEAVEDNQLLSLFFRVSPPRSGVEVYGEFLRDDHSYDVNDLVGEPAHESAWALGMRRLWQPTASGKPLTTVTVEAANGRISHIVRLRLQVPMYVHARVTEGHTLRGQLLASPAVFGGGGYSVEFSRRGAAVGWTAALRSEAIAQNMEGGTWNGTRVGFHSLEVARIWSRGRAEFTVGADTQIGWNALSGGRNFGLSMTVRPIATIPAPAR